MIIEIYSNDCLNAITDTKQGTGSCDYIAAACSLLFYFLRSICSFISPRKEL